MRSAVAGTGSARPMPRRSRPIGWFLPPGDRPPSVGPCGSRRPPMAEGRTIRSLGVETPGRMHLWTYQEAPLAPGQFQVETLYSGFSAGTELTFVKGTNPYLEARWDADYGVFVPDEPSARFPVPFLGYMEVGRVIESRT